MRRFYLMLLLLTVAGVAFGQVRIPVQGQNTGEAAEEGRRAVERTQSIPSGVQNAISGQQIRQMEMREKREMERRNYNMREVTNCEYDPNATVRNIVSRALWDLQFNYDVQTASGGESNLAGAETDGNFIYVTKWNGDLIFKFDMDGNFIESFSISGVSGLRDLAYSEATGYFYGSNATSGTGIWEMDFSSQTLVSTIATTEEVRSIAYNDDLDVFYVNNWDGDIAVVERTTGTTLSTFAAPASMYGSAYDNWSDNGPYLWCFTGTSNGGGCQVEQVELSGFTSTGTSYSISDNIADGIAGGLFVHPDIVTGFATLGGCSQGTANDFVFGLELAVTVPPDYDLGIVSIDAPLSGESLTNAETVTITLKNNGSEAMSNPTVYYIFEGNVVTEPLTGVTINSDDTYTHDFGTTVDLSGVGAYPLEVGLTHPDDEVENNNVKTTTIVHSIPAAEVYPQSADYWTGTTDGTTKTEISLINGYDTEDGWAKFDISSIPDGSTINSIHFFGYVNATNWPYWSITPLATDPVSGDAATIYQEIQGNTGTATAYSYNNESSSFATGWHSYELTNDATTDMEAMLTDDWFAVGIASRDNSTTYYITLDGWNETNTPYLVVDYTAPVMANAEAVSVDIPEYVESGTVTPQATVKNAGTETQTFDVTLTITGGYADAQTVTDLAPGDEIQLTFADWNATEGMYMAKLTTHLAGDEVPENDEITKTINVLPTLTEAYLYNAYDVSGTIPVGPAMTYLEAPQIVTSLADQSAEDFIAAASWAEGMWVGSDYNGNLVQLDTQTGARTVVASIGISFAGMSYNWVERRMYGLDFDGNLYKVNMASAMAEMIGNVGTTGFINMACNLDGTLYAVNISDDQLYSIDPATAVATAIGPIGFDASYAQDMEFDHNSGTLYYAGYSDADGGGLYTIDLTTGTATLVDMFANNIEATGFAVPYSGPPAAEIVDYSVPGQEGATVLDATARTVNVDMPYGTDLTALVADFVLTEGATATVGATVQESGVTANDFTSPLTYTVDNGAISNDWTVTVSELPPSTETEILTYTFPEAIETNFNTVSSTIEVLVPNGTDVTALVADFTLSEAATATVGGVTQESGITANDFTNPVDYVVTAQDGSTTQTWTVTVVQGEPPCYFSLELYDSYGDGWNGGVLDVYVNGQLHTGGLTISGGGGPEVYDIEVSKGDCIFVDYVAGSWSSENSYYVYDALGGSTGGGTEIFSSGLSGTPDDANIGVLCGETTDMAMMTIDAPTSACGLTDSETVTVTFGNTGTDPVAAGTVVEVYYAIDGGSPVMETVTVSPTLSSCETITHTFATNADLSTPGMHLIEVWVSLTGDLNPDNDMASTNVNHIPALTEGGLVDFEAFNPETDVVVFEGPQANVYHHEHAANTGMYGLMLSGKTSTNWSNPSGGNEWTINEDHSATVSFCIDATAIDYPALDVDIKQEYSYNPIYSNMRVLVDGAQISGTFLPATAVDDPYETQTFDLTAYGNQSFVLTFETRNKYDYMYYNNGDNTLLDNLYLYALPENDIAVNEMVSPEQQVLTEADYTLSVEIENIGAMTQTVDVTATIGTFTSTKTVVDLAPGTVTDVVFDDLWTATLGDHTIEFSVTPDEVTTNDMISMNIKVVEPVDVYTYVTTPNASAVPEGPATLTIPDAASLASIADQTGQDFIGGATWMEGKWIGSSYWNADLMELDPTTGARTLVDNLGISFVGLAYNWDNNLLYGLTFGGDLYSIDLTNAVTNMVGSFSGVGSFMNLACDANGVLYSIDSDSDQLYTLDPATGTATPVGSLGVDNTYYFQEMSFDLNTGLLWAVTYTDEFGGVLALIDHNTGEAMYAGNFDGDAQVAGLAIPFSGPAEANIIAYSFPEQTEPTVIDTDNYEVHINLTGGTDVTALVANFILSEGATATVGGATQESGITANDFTTPVVYTVENGSVSQDWTVYVNVYPPSIEAYSITGQIGSSVIDSDAQTVDVLVPYGFDLSSVVPDFTLSPNAEATVAGVPQESGVTAVNLMLPVTYELTDNNTSASWTVTVEDELNTAAEIVSYQFPGLQPTATNINSTTNYIEVELLEGTSTDALVAEFTLSGGATAYIGGVMQESGVTENNFNSIVTYTVVAEDGVTEETWFVDVTVPLSSYSNATDFLAFSFPQQTGAATIDPANHTINVEVVNSADLTNLVADFQLSAGATATVNSQAQVSGVTPNDFSIPVGYLVTAEDGTTTQSWVVYVTKSTVLNSGKDFLSYTFPQAVEPTVFDYNAHTLAVDVEASDITGLIAEFELSLGAEATVNTTTQQSTVTDNDFSTGPVTYTVTAEDGSSVDWTATVYALPEFTTTPVEAAIIDMPYSYEIQTADANVNDVLNINAVDIPAWASLSATTSNGSGGYTATLSGTPSTLANENVELEVVDTDGRTSTQAFTINVMNDDATLTDLQYNATTVPGFSSTTLTYNVDLPSTTVDPPVVTATPADPNAVVDIVQPTDPNGEATITVTAESGSVSTYHIYFYVMSGDATLSNLLYDGTQVPGFDPNTTTYDVDLLSSVTNPPVVTASVNDPNANKEITQASALPGTATVVVTAEDPAVTMTYTINFDLLSGDATLATLTPSEGTLDPAFDPDVQDYTVDLPSTTTDIPTVDATANDPDITSINIDQPTAIDGEAVVTIVAEDPNVSLTYTVDFYQLNGDASLSDLTVDGTTIDGFDPAVFDYAMEVMTGSAIPQVDATLNNTLATMTVTQASDLPGTATVDVTAEDPAVTATYSVEFMEIFPIEFNVDMTGPINNGLFDPLAKGSVDVAGNFTDWGNSPVLMDDPDGDYIYTVEIESDFENAGFQAGDELEFKFRMHDNDGNIVWEWDGTSHENRFHTVVDGDNIISVNWEDWTTGVDALDASAISIYPNPSNGKVTITNVANADIYVFNMLGELVTTTANADITTHIDLSQYAKGTYIVKIVRGDSIVTSKIDIVD